MLVTTRLTSFVQITRKPINHALTAPGIRTNAVITNSKTSWRHFFFDSVQSPAVKTPYRDVYADDTALNCVQSAIFETDGSDKLHQNKIRCGKL